MRENTARRQPSTSQKERPHQKPLLMTTGFQPFRLQNSEKINFSRLSHSVSGILLWQSQQINPASILLTPYKLTFCQLVKRTRRIMAVQQPREAQSPWRHIDLQLLVHQQIFTKRLLWAQLCLSMSEYMSESKRQRYLSSGKAVS